MGRLDTERGPVLRVFEFDRYNGTVFQVDMMLSNGSFVAHPRCALMHSKPLFPISNLALSAAPTHC